VTWLGSSHPKYCPLWSLKFITVLSLEGVFKRQNHDEVPGFKVDNTSDTVDDPNDVI